MFVARNVVKMKDQELDQFEDICVELIPINQVRAMIQNNHIKHSICLTALCFFLLRLEEY